MYWRILLMLAAAAATPLRAEDRPAQAGDFIEVFQGLFGEHRGERKGHAKGVCAVGSFTGSADAARMFSAPLFSGTRWPAQIRFSMAGGDPAVADNARSPRGLAAQFELEEGRVHNIATLSTPVFGAATPESFLGLLRASLPGADGRPDADKVAAYRAAHPDTLPQFRWLQQNSPPWSYASAAYFGLHTFHFATADGERAVRWRLQPRDGVRGLTDEERAAAPRDFLAARSPSGWPAVRSCSTGSSPSVSPATVSPTRRAPGLTVAANWWRVRCPSPPSAATPVPVSTSTPTC